MTTLILIRHGETDWNVEGRYQGQADPSLNAKGRAQGLSLAAALGANPPDLFYASPLRRAIETAEILAAELSAPLFTDNRLVEIHQGDWQGRLRGEIASKYPDLFKQWETDPWKVTPPGGESLIQVQTRVLTAIEEILASHAGKRIGLVLHRIPIALLKVRYQNMDPDVVRTLSLPNTYWEEVFTPQT
jgi:broad specificity phosphatase PhoE